MEAAGLRRRRNKKAPIGTFLLLMSLFLPASCLIEEVKKEPTCPHGDYLTEEGICCNKCSPGFKLVEKCHAVGQRSNCTACPDNQFTDQLNYAQNCRRCRRCKQENNEEVAEPCERYQNTVCRCKKGFYKFRIDSETYDCRRCSKCRPDEQLEHPCSQNENTVCGCKENFYRGPKRACEPCKSCSDDCKLYCTSPPMLNTKGPDRTYDLVPVVVGVVAVAAVLLSLGIFITYMTTKRFTKMKLLRSSSQLAETSPDSCQESLVYSEGSSENNMAQRFMVKQETSNLPDCVPLEINIPDLIYLVLDQVPVLQVKQLVRCLGVKDSEIEQADLDHRSCREAHYQMLRVWAERGSRTAGGGGTLLPLPLLQELIDKLRLMHLGGAAEELEAKYCIQ